MKFKCLNCGLEWIEDVFEYGALIVCPKCKSKITKKIGFGSEVK